MISPIHKEARRLAALGWPVFPCVPLGKEPATARGFHAATTDPAQIDAWWTENPDYNLAFQPQKAGLAVIDPDGEAGLAAWAELELLHGCAPETLTVNTARGGKHLYFIGDLPPSQSKLGPHVDTRGGGSYALMPPSRFRDPATGIIGEYVYANTTTPAMLPAWVGRRLAELSEVCLQASDIELDQPQNISRAKAYLENLVKSGGVAIEGQMGDLKTFVTACWCLNLGVSAEKTVELMLDHWNDHCLPPWDADELAAKVDNASRYAQNGEGAWAVEPSSVTFASALGSMGVTEQAVARKSRYKLLSEAEQDNLPEPVWLIPNLLTTNAIGMVYGPSMTFKSFLGIDLGMSVAAGLRTWGLDGVARPVVYCAGEGPFAIARKRRPVWRLARQVEGPVPFYLVGAMPSCAAPDTVEEFIAQVREADVQPALVIIDTLARFMVGFNESDAKDASIATAALEHIKDSLGCSVLALHHTGKDVARGARGSSALLGNFDTQHEVVRAEGTLAVALHPRKQKDAELGDPWLFEGKALGGSLVFDQVSSVRWSELTQHEGGGFTNRAIGQALANLGAVGAENHVTPHVLAGELTLPSEGETHEQYAERVESAERRLRKKTRSDTGLYWPETSLWGHPAKAN